MVKNIKAFGKFFNILFNAFILIAVLAYESNAQKYKIGISQIVDHPSLNANRKGVEDSLKDHMADDYQIYTKIANGNIAISSQIATTFISQKMDVIVAISTQSAQNTVSARKNNDIPLVFTGVTDPISAGVVKDLNFNIQNITGVTDFPPISKMKNFIKTIKKINKIGILYNLSESNSLEVVKQIEQDFSPDFEIIKASAGSTIEITQIAKKLMDKVDAIVLPSDNTIFSALDHLSSLSKRYKKPIFSFDSDSVKKGVFATLGYNQYDLGYLAGKLIIKALNCENAGQIPIVSLPNHQLIINKDLLDVFDIKFEEEVINKAILWSKS